MSNSRSDSWGLVIAGCGTVGLAVTRAVAARGSSWHRLRSITFLDHAVVQRHNRLTCPEYAGRIGQPKPLVLADFVRHGLPEGIGIRWSDQYVEEVDWPQLLVDAADGLAPLSRLVTVIGLDDWQSRLSVVEDLRHLAAQHGVDAPAIQVAVERGEAQVSVLGSRWEDPCPACGLAVLPEREPCVLPAANGALLRGSLQRESEAAAALVVEVLQSLAEVQDSQRWMNTKTNLVEMHSRDQQLSRLRRKANRVSSCPGPHSRSGPMRFEQLVKQKDHADV